jgi:hypothetical protein
MGNNGKWLKRWCKGPKSQNLHHHFQRLRADDAGAGVNLSVEHPLDRCSPVKRGAFYQK